MLKLDYNNTGELTECIGCKIKHKGNRMKLTHPVLAQNLNDEFEISNDVPCNLPAPHGKELTSDSESLTEEEKKVCQSRVRKLLFLMCHARPDILNTARELSK